MRNCGDCTKCCEKYLSRNIFGKFEENTDCTYVKINEGCTIYEKRPVECVNFKCGWIVEDEMPDKFKPNKSNVMIRFVDYPRTLIVLELEPDSITPQLLDWATNYAIINNYKVRVNKK